jgi:hypothetical protein
MIDSPAGERMPWKIPRALSGHSAHVRGRTIASMYASALTRSGYRAAQWKPSAEPQSWTTSVTSPASPSASNHASRYRA